MIKAVTDHILLLSTLEEMYAEQMKVDNWTAAYCTYVAMIDECKRTTKFLEEGGLRQSLQQSLFNRTLVEAQKKIKGK